jgi:hypothetical protein
MQMMEAVYSSETSVLTRATRRNVPENGIFHSDRRENLKHPPFSFPYFQREYLQATNFLIRWT